MNSITISRVEYELLLIANSKLELVTEIINKDDTEDYFMNNNIRKMLKLVLGIDEKKNVG